MTELIRKLEKVYQQASVEQRQNKLNVFTIPAHYVNPPHIYRGHYVYKYSLKDGRLKFGPCGSGSTIRKVPDPKRTATPEQKSEVIELIKTLSIPQIRIITGLSYSTIEQIFQEYLHNRAIQSTVDLSDIKVQYYESEADILQELEASYRAEDLKGEELEIFKNML
jgi:hypothetical protein